MESKLKKVELLMSELFKENDITKSLKYYKKGLELLDKSETNLENIKEKITDVDHEMLDITTIDFSNYNLNNEILRLNSLLEENKEKNILLEKLVENYIEAKQIINKCKVFINEYKSSIKQLIKDEDNNIIEIDFQ